MVIRYTSLYSEKVEAILNEAEVNDYIFTDNIDFIKYDKVSNKIRPQKNIGLIISLDEDKMARFETIFKKALFENEELKNKIKYFAMPIYKDG